MALNCMAPWHCIILLRTVGCVQFFVHPKNGSRDHQIFFFVSLSTVGSHNWLSCVLVPTTKTHMALC